MLDQKQIELIDRKLNQVHEVHVGQLLNITNRLVGQIEPNSNATIANCIEAFPRETLTAVNGYGDQIGQKITDTVTALNVILGKNDKDRLIATVERYLEESLYEKRFQVFLDSIQRKIGQYGKTVDLQQYRADIQKSLHDVGIRNMIRSKVVKVQNELEVLSWRSSGKANFEEIRAQSRKAEVEAQHFRKHLIGLNTGGVAFIIVILQLSKFSLSILTINSLVCFVSGLIGTMQSTDLAKTKALKRLEALKQGTNIPDFSKYNDRNQTVDRNSLYLFLAGAFFEVLELIRLWSEWN